MRITKTHHYTNGLSKENNINKIKIFALSRLSFFSFCLVATLISITQIFPKSSSVFAEDNNNNSTVSTSSSATASVTVSSACSFSRTNESDGNYTSTLSNGHDTEIIGSTFRTICNDPGGYSIYAIGYSNNTLGNTDLIFNNTPESTNNIKTDGDTQTGSNGSYWKMKATSATENNTPATIETAYNNTYGNIPNVYTKIASLNTITDSAGTTQANIKGSSISITYKAYASSTQPAGTYTGAVKYTMVHPNTNIPNEPKNCATNKICYYPNAGNTVSDTMGDQSITSSDTSATLWASNFQRSGYGFAGWSDAYDYVVNEGSESDSEATIYGPNETISFTAGEYSNSATSGLSLYAVWVEPAKDTNGNELTFQTSNLLTTTLADNSTLSSKNNGYVTALRDKRDGQVYAIAKLADGNYWMIENLRLNAGYTRGSYYQGLAQGYGANATYGNFIGLANAESANFADDTTANSVYYSGTQSGTASVNIGTSNDPGYRMPRYNNNNTGSTTQGMTDTDANVYSYGNYYTWHAVIADTTYYDSHNSSVTTTSLCPSGWRLPKGGQSTVNTTADFYVLTKTLAGLEPNNPNNGYSYYEGTVDGVDMGTLASNVLRDYPNNFVYSGISYDSSVLSRGLNGHYWSSSVHGNLHAYNLYLRSSNVYPGTSTYPKYYGFSVRCITE